MKRSEALELIEEVLFHKIMDWDTENYKPEAANILLSSLEEVGFKPPCSCYDDPERTEEKGYGARCGISWHLHEWSPEGAE